MKRVLIISPYFPPANAADMQRVRMSLPYFKDFGWHCEVIAVDERFVPIEKDLLLLETIPADIKIHRITAHKSTGMAGSISLRSFRSYRKFVSQLLSNSHFDLIYFSTTQFPLCALGAFWKKRFNIPYVIDMQDPWYTGRYQNIERRNLKSRVMYRLHKYLEHKAMKQVGGLISVSKHYLESLTTKYPHLSEIPQAVIPFGASKNDLEIASQHAVEFENLFDPNTKNIVYIGRGGADLHRAITPIFFALKELSTLPCNIKLYFIGTSYFPGTDGNLSILQLAKQLDVEQNVIELPKRVGYFHTLNMLQRADALFIPGSEDRGYNASKIHPYIMVGKPILSVLNTDSPASAILNEYGVQRVFSYDNPTLVDLIKEFLTVLVNDDLLPDQYDQNTINKYSANNLTRQQCEVFNAALQN